MQPSFEVRSLTPDEQEIADQLAEDLRRKWGPPHQIGLHIWKVCNDAGVDHHLIAHHLGNRAGAKASAQSKTSKADVQADAQTHLPFEPAPSAEPKSQPAKRRTFRLTDKKFQEPKLKPFKIPDGFILIQDTREQQPLFLRPPKGLTVLTDTLTDGDYSIQGFQDCFAVERKTPGDFMQYIGQQRDKTTVKLQRFRAMIQQGGFAALVIEDTESAILSGTMHSSMTPEQIRQSLVSFEVKFGLHIFYCKNRDDIARWIVDRAIKFYNMRKEVG